MDTPTGTPARKYTLPWSLGVNDHLQWALRASYPMGTVPSGTQRMVVEERPEGLVVLLTREELDARIARGEFTITSDWHDLPLAGIVVGDQFSADAREIYRRATEEHTLKGVATHPGLDGYTLPWCLGMDAEGRIAVRSTYPVSSVRAGTFTLHVRGNTDGLHVDMDREAYQHALVNRYFHGTGTWSDLPVATLRVDGRVLSAAIVAHDAARRRNPIERWNQRRTSGVEFT